MSDQPMKADDEKFCTSCGALIKKAAEICPKCGVRQLPAPVQNESVTPVSQEGAEGILKFVSCCAPIVGVILYFVWKDSKPQASKDVCHWAIIGLVIGLVVYGVSALIGMASTF